VAQEIDPSSHAEVRAIRKATKRLKQISLAGYTL
jgi:tRNA(Arg) A34 adenosine deaminase TadA